MQVNKVVTLHDKGTSGYQFVTNTNYYQDGVLTLATLCEDPGTLACKDADGDDVGIMNHGPLGELDIEDDNGLILVATSVVNDDIIDDIALNLPSTSFSGTFIYSNDVYVHYTYTEDAAGKVIVFVKVRTDSDYP